MKKQIITIGEGKEIGKGQSISLEQRTTKSIREKADRLTQKINNLIDEFGKENQVIPIIDKINADQIKICFAVDVRTLS